jgi:tryptophanyl-tRNA synthetase
VPQKRILSLKNPSEKMSKSAPNPLSRISITDSSKDIEKKIKGAVTDADPNITFDPVARPGVANLLTIWSALDDSGRTPAQLAEMAAAEGWGAGKLKGAVAEVVITKLAPVREEYARIVADPGYIRDCAAKGAERARETAEKTMVEVRKVVGLGDI